VAVPLLILLGSARLALHLLTNGQYGFHRDELAVLDDAGRLAWGYVAYPPVTPFIGRLALELFGPSLVGLRFFSALAQSIAMVLAGLIARELGGSRWAQAVAAVAAAVAPMSLIMASMFQYVAFDYLWWVAVAYLVVRLLNSGDPRWWVGIGLAIGLGMMTKYTMAFCVAGLVAGVLFTPVRRHLRSPWLWGGVAVSLLVFAPNLIWQIQHDFVSLECLSAIHQRDIEIGRTGGFLAQQLYVSANPFSIPFWIAGLYFCFFSARGAPYRILGWMYVVPLALFLAAQGRFYYLAPAYPALIAAGAVVIQERLASLSRGPARSLRGAVWAMLAVGAVMAGALMLPVAPVNSGLWKLNSGVHDNFVEQIGWPELVETVAGIYAALPEEEKPAAGILAGNYGEAGAINLFGPAYGLPTAISGINSYWLRGFGDPPPQTLIVLGLSRDFLERHFAECEPAGQVSNRFGVENEETRFHKDIWICRGLLQPWPDFWKNFRYFG